METDDGAPQVQQWLQEKTRLQLVVATALRQLITHLGTHDLDLPFEGAWLQIRKVTGQGGEVHNPQVAPSDVPTSSTPLAPS